MFFTVASFPMFPISLVSNTVAISVDFEMKINKET
jgi:hypothetical protein